MGKNGKCNGTATITFVRKGDGMAAIKEYNGVPLDGQPMQLDIVGAPTADQQRAPVRSRPQFRAEQSFEPRQQTFQRKGKGSKGGKGRGGGKGPREDRAPVTETDLDDEEDDFEDDEEEEEEYEAPARSLQTKSARAALSTGTSVQVSNLHADVTEEDMHE